MLKYLLSILVVVVALITSSFDAPAAETQNGLRERISQALSMNGEAALSQGEALQAMQHFESALVSNPKNASAYVGLGRAHAAVDRRKTAMSSFAVALEIDPNNQHALEHQSLGFLDQGKISAAERNLNRLKRLCASGCASLETVEDALDAYLQKTQDAILSGSEQQASATP